MISGGAGTLFISQLFGQWKKPTPNVSFHLPAPLYCLATISQAPPRVQSHWSGALCTEELLPERALRLLLGKGCLYPFHLWGSRLGLLSCRIWDMSFRE